MKIYFLPKTTLGKWSAVCIAAFIVLLLVARILVASGQEGGETIFSNLVIGIPMALACLSGVMAFLLGVFGIIAAKERSIIVFACTFIGFLVLALILGEVVSPH